VRFKRLIRSPSCCCTLTDPRTLRPAKKIIFNVPCNGFSESPWVFETFNETRLNKERLNDYFIKKDTCVLVCAFLEATLSKINIKENRTEDGSLGDTFVNT